MRLIVGEAMFSPNKTSPKKQKSRLFDYLRVSKFCVLKIKKILAVRYLYFCFGLVSLFLLNGCVSYSGLLNYNEAPSIPTAPQAITNYQPILIQTSDILQLSISSLDPLATAAFSGGAAGEGGQTASGFVVSSDGTIDLPTLGSVKVEGLRIEEAKTKIVELLQPYFKQAPIVNLRLLNFKVNVNGEVRSPGTFTVNNDRLTIIEAVTLAGDFTSYSRRDSILIIRENNGMRSFGYINFNSSDVFNSPYFYLQQNDVVYVQPEKTKVGSIRDPVSRFLPWVSAIASLTAIVITLTR